MITLKYGRPIRIEKSWLGHINGVGGVRYIWYRFEPISNIVIGSQNSHDASGILSRRSFSSDYNPMCMGTANYHAVSFTGHEGVIGKFS